MAALRKDRFLAVVVDCDTAEVDVLEVILNIRDLDERLRVFVLSDSEIELGGPRARPYVSVVKRDQLLHELTPTPVHVSEAGRGEDADGQKLKPESDGGNR
jgi:hypothetical protein